MPIEPWISFTDWSTSRWAEFNILPVDTCLLNWRTLPSPSVGRCGNFFSTAWARLIFCHSIPCSLGPFSLRRSIALWHSIQRIPSDVRRCFRLRITSWHLWQRKHGSQSVTIASALMTFSQTLLWYILQLWQLNAPSGSKKTVESVPQRLPQDVQR